MAEHDRIPPALYHVAALDILAQRGPSGLHAATLCTALGVPITSVDEEFGSWPGFVEALLEHWESEQTWAPVELTLARADPWQRIEMLKHLATTVPHAAEAAIRAWSHSDPVVHRIQVRVDAQRVEALRQVIAGVGIGTPSHAGSRRWVSRCSPACSSSTRRSTWTSYVRCSPSTSSSSCRTRAEQAADLQ